MPMRTVRSNDGTQSLEMVADKQRSKVYKWENACVKNFRTGTGMTLNECQAFAEKALRWWFRGDVPPVKVKHQPRMTSRAFAYGWWRISLPDWAKCKGVILHEVAHIIVNRHDLHHCDGGHGAYFVRVFISLAGFFLKCDRKYLKATAKEYGVKFVDYKELPRPMRKDRGAADRLNRSMNMPNADNMLATGQFQRQFETIIKLTKF